MKKILITLMLVLISTGAFAQDHQSWKFMHPLPQCNPVNRLSMLDANTWLGVGSYGTFMKTTNAGSNWYINSSAGRMGSALSSGSLGDIKILDANTAIVCGANGYLARTTNGGVTFDTVGSGLLSTTYGYRKMWFADPNTGYAVAYYPSGFGGGIVKTVNSGLTWTLLYSTTATTVMAVGGTSASNVFVLQADGSMMHSTNGGSNWTTSSQYSYLVFGFDVTFINANTGFAGGESGNLGRTTNGGVTWDSLPTPQADWSYYQIKAISPSEIYLVGHPAYLYKTSDLGNTWSALPINVPISTTYLWNTLDKSGSTYTIGGDYGIVAQSTDGCNTWTTKNFQLSTQIMFDIKTIPGTSNVMAVGRPYTVGTRQVMKSTNGGLNWTAYNTGVDAEFYALSMINANTGYMSGQYSKVMKTTDGGQNWVSKTNASGSNYSLYSCKFINENTGWVFVNYLNVSGGNVFKTTDGALTWNQYSVGNGSSENIMSADMFDANTGYCTMNPSGQPVYKTINGGVNWTASPIPITGNISSVKAVDGNTVYISSSSGTNRIAKTTNGGTNWTAITLPAVFDVKSIDFKDANTGYACGNLTTAICRTTDGGLTWSFQNAHVGTLGKITVSAGDTAYVSGIYTTIMRAVGSTMTGVEYNSHIMANNYELKQNYPNPFNPTTTIEFNLPKAGNVSVKVFDIAGREYATDINNMSLNAGNFKMNFNGTKMATGVYFYSLVVDGVNMATKKLVLIK
jgi:photosystem II stability/assembly factor-like uncharacterized protein